MDDHSGTTEPTIILTGPHETRPLIVASTTGFKCGIHSPGSKNILTRSSLNFDTVEEIDINPFVLTTYQINDYVLRRQIQNSSCHVLYLFQHSPKNREQHHAAVTRELGIALVMADSTIPHLIDLEKDTAEVLDR